MSRREVQLEDLVGRVVRTEAGRPVGVIRDFCAEPSGEEYLVREILIGELGWRAKLLGMIQQLPTFRALGLGRRYRMRAVSWRWLDFSDPERPRFRSPSSGRER